MTSSEPGSETYGALPSSYRRRIRKSRSLATVQSRNLRVRLKRSIPFLRHQSTTTLRQTGSSAPWERREEAIQLARAHYLSGSDGLRPPGFDTSGSPKVEQRDYRIFRKSVRTRADLDDDSAASKRSFSLSTTIRNSFRRAIGRPLNKRDDAPPPQQLEGQRSYFAGFDQDADSSRGFDAYQVAEDAITSSGGSAVGPTSEVLEELDTFPYAVASATSRESLHSNARSRVTSWTNSTTSGSVALRSGPIERNRLSIIKEDGGPHQPSSSAGRHIGGVEPLGETLQTPPPEGVLSPSVDTHRIYSALIKRIQADEEEVERTRLAVERLNDEQNQEIKDRSTFKPTIRAVYSDPSLASLADRENGSRVDSLSCSWASGRTEHGTVVNLAGKGDSARRREQLADQQSQSSFFPFSNQNSPNTPSPFKKFLNERRSRTRTRSQSRSHSRGRSRDEDDSSVIVKRQRSNTVMNRPRFGLSEASFYSRTTNGGSNEQYIRPIESSEDLPSKSFAESGPAGTAIIFPSASASCVQRRWNPWADGPDQHRRVSSDNPKGTETAQPNSDIDANNGGNVAWQAHQQHNAWVESTPTNATKLELRLVTGPNHCQDRLHRQSGIDALSLNSNKADDGSKGSSSLRKLSPGNLRRLLKNSKSHPRVRLQHAGKENSPMSQDHSPPISTPGRFHMQFPNGNSTGRLRKRASETVFDHNRNSGRSTRQGEISSTPSRSNESPGGSGKDHLVARLSRPFNMDVPAQNRPFDSMYLGKRTPGHPDMFGNSRLSVAPRAPGENTSPSPESTALPKPSSLGARNAVRLFGRLGSNRMVSNFLRSRRRDRSTASAEQVPGNVGPAFV
jgi:hypothetical protein